MRKLIKWIFGKKEPVLFLVTDGYEIVLSRFAFSQAEIFTKLDFKKLVWVHKELHFQTREGLIFVTKQNWELFFSEFCF